MTKKTIKKQPERRCTGCKGMKTKNELIRIVKSESGEFFIDTTFKMQGRGAYICKNTDCLELAIKSRGLDRSFKTSVPKEVYENIKANGGGIHG